MTRWWRWTVALLLCAAGAVLGPVPTAAADPAAETGFGTVLADLGTAPSGTTEPGFSFDGAYYAYLSPSGDRCDLRLRDLRARRQVDLVHAHVVCDSALVRWAAHADSLQWQVNAADGDVIAYVWDADPGQVSVLASDAHVFTTSGLSGDGRFLAFSGRSDSHPAPSVDAPRFAGYVYDRGSDVSLPLSKPDLHVQFGEWGPTGNNFFAATGGRSLDDPKTGSCFGSGTSCSTPTDPHPFFSYDWSRDGTAVVGELLLSESTTTTVHDFTDGSSTPFPPQPGHVDYAEFIGPTADRVLGYIRSGSSVWDRTSGTVEEITDQPGYLSPSGRYLLVSDDQPDVYRYRNVSSGASALAAYRGTGGSWTKDGSFFLGVGPGGCSSLRQWSPATNTVSLFGPPGTATCYLPPSRLSEGPRSSASGRFALVDKQASQGEVRSYVVDLRRHVLAGPLTGYGGPFAPAGSDVLVVRQPLASGGYRLLLVDPTPAPDVDDKPRWSAETPATGSRFDVVVGEQAHVKLGASDLQGTPVNLYFRWRTAAGVPVASAPQGWSCNRRRLAGGATEADCTFAPTAVKDVRYLDVSATNFATGAQSDTRSYRIGSKPTATAPRR